MNKPQTFTKRFCYYSIIGDFVLSLIAFFVMFVSFQVDEKTDELIINPNLVIAFTIISAVLFIGLVVYHYFYYKNSNYQFNEKGIVCKKGVFFKKTSLIEYSKIHAINKKQGLIQKVFDIAILLIDSGATQNSQIEEITIIERSNIVDELVKIIKHKQEHQEEVITNEEVQGEIKEEHVNLYNFTSKSKIIYSLLTTLSSVLIVTVAIVILLISMATLSKWIGFGDGGVEMFVLMIILGYIGISGISFIGSIISSMLGYYNFIVYKENRTITISYGLFEKNNNSFNIDRIKAVKIKTNIIKRLFGFATIELEVIGYGNTTNNDEKKKEKVFIPLCKKSEVNDYIEKILGSEYLLLPKENSCKSYFALWSWKVLIFSTIVIFIYLVGLIWMLIFDKTAILPISLICLLVIFVIDASIILTAYLKYRFEGITIGEDKICLYHGGVYQDTTIFLKRHIIGIEEVTTPKRKQKNISTYILHFRNNAAENEAKVEIQSSLLKEELLESLKY